MTRRLLIALLLSCFAAGCALLMGPSMTARDDSRRAVEAAESVLYGVDDWCRSGWFGRLRADCEAVRVPSSALVAAANAFHVAADADRADRRRDLRIAIRVTESAIARELHWWYRPWFEEPLSNLHWSVDQTERREAGR